MDNEYQPTGPEIDDRQWHGGKSYNLVEEYKMGSMTSACIIWVAAGLIFFFGFLLGFATKALFF